MGCRGSSFLLLGQPRSRSLTLDLFLPRFLSKQHKRTAIRLGFSCNIYLDNVLNSQLVLCVYLLWTKREKRSKWSISSLPPFFKNPLKEKVLGRTRMFKTCECMSTCSEFRNMHRWMYEAKKIYVYMKVYAMKIKNWRREWEISPLNRP